MRNKGILLILLMLASFFNIYGQSVRSITFNSKDLLALKQEAATNPKIITAKKQLLRKSDQILRDKKKYSVVFNGSVWTKADRNDYTSMHPYLWPNPKTKNGLPYIHIDGKRNRHTEQVSDKSMLDGLANDILHLGLSYFYTEDEKYVKWATELLNCFFVDPNTRMNPNVDFSQTIPGKEGSGGTIMEAVLFINVIEGVQLMRYSKNFPGKLDSNLNAWFSDFLVWLETSPKGKINSKHENNRGTYYTLLRCDIAMFLNDRQLAANIFKKEAFNRVTDQISNQGTLERELARPVPLGYVKYNLSGFKQLNEIGNTLGFDLLNYEGPNGQSLEKAFKWLDKYKQGDATWKYSDEIGIPSVKRLKMKKGEENLLRFSVIRFTNYLEDLTTY